MLGRHQAAEVAGVEAAAGQQRDGRAELGREEGEQEEVVQEGAAHEAATRPSDWIELRAEFEVPFCRHIKTAS